MRRKIKRGPPQRRDTEYARAETRGRAAGTGRLAAPGRIKLGTGDTPKASRASLMQHAARSN
eukprot:6271928-Alexandrium_andersonii.AAC.1